MKVLMILTNGFLPDLRVLKEAKYIEKLGYEVEILCWDRENRFVDRPIEQIGNIKITRFFQKSQYGSGLKQIFKLLQYKNACKKYIKESKMSYSFIHCHDLDGMVVGYLLHKHGDKLIFDMHEFYNSGSYEKIYFIIKRLIHFLQNKSYKIIHVNEKQIENISKENKRKLVYLPNFPEIADFQSIQHVESEKLRITYVGYVRHLNPLLNLMKACGNNTQVTISIHGEGEIFDIIQEEKQKYNNVIITGAFKRSEVKEIYENSDVMYIVYNKGNKNDESALPTKFFEAIISEKPVIVSKNSKLEDMINKYDIGFAVDGTDVKEIKDCINKILNNPEILIKKRENIKKIKTNFIWDDIVKNLNEIYRENQ